MERLFSSGPSTWPGVSELPSGDEARERVLHDFEADCTAFADHYPFRLSVENVFAISNTELSAASQEQRLRMGEPQLRRLYHGTSRDSARAICTDGFVLPGHAGMFGKGVYFAETPLKSWRYSSGKGSRFMIVAEVALGATKVTRKARPELNPEVDFQRSWLLQLICCARDFDSLQAVSKCDGGAVNVPEYVVYRHEQALPIYILQVREHRKPDS